MTTSSQNKGNQSYSGDFTTVFFRENARFTVFPKYFTFKNRFRNRSKLQFLEGNETLGMFTVSIERKFPFLSAPMKSPPGILTDQMLINFGDGKNPASFLTTTKLKHPSFSGTIFFEIHFFFVRKYDKLMDFEFRGKWKPVIRLLIQGDMVSRRGLFPIKSRGFSRLRRGPQNH